MKKLINFCLIGVLAISANAQNVNIVQRSRVPYPGTSNIWGYVDTTNKEYALVGANDRLSIVDVTNPDAPVKRFSVPGPNSEWREIRTWGKYAYVTTEGGGGVTIVNLSKLPDTVTYKHYTGDAGIANQLNAIHALHIDNGKLYLYGGGLQQGKAKVISLADPWNPHYLGTVSNRYVHDGFVRNDTLYSCQVYDGLLEIIDARNPLAPVVIASQVTPKQFTHNSWMSTNRKVIYTTDEVSGSWVTAYDITDMQNIKELDRYRHNNSGSIGHNTYIMNNSTVTGSNTDYLWTSYYRDGITVVDASRPDNLVEVGNFDSSPAYSGDGFNGAWGVYAYLPSGNVLISDMEMGLYVVTPTYKRACFLEGIVKDAQTNLAIAGANITVAGKSILDGTTSLTGSYKSGTVDSGTYVVHVSYPGYIAQDITVHLANGEVTPLNVSLSKRVNFAFTTLIKDSANNSLPNAHIILKNAEFTYETTSDANGTISFPIFYAGKYAMYVGAFGYKTTFVDSTNYLTVNDIPNIKLAKGYYDDFLFDYAWTATSTASTGDWVKAKPIRTTLNGTICNPDFDISNDFGDQCYVTGNASGNVTTADIDGGVVTLRSPSMDLTTYSNPYINYQRWFSNVATSGTANDTLTIYLTNGTQTAILEQQIGTIADRGQWVAKTHRVKDFMTPSNNMKLIVKAGDYGTDNIVEAGLDKFSVTDSLTSGVTSKLNSVFAKAFPNPTNAAIQVSYSFAKSNEGKLSVYDILGNVVFKKDLKESHGMVNINVENKGMYFIRIESNNEQQVIKFTKQ